MENKPSFFTKQLALKLAGGTALGAILGLVVHFKMQVNDSVHELARGGNAASGQLTVWESMGMLIGLCLTAILILTACDFWFARKKRKSEETTGGVSWMTPWCQTLADSPDFCFEPAQVPMDLPMECRLEVRCVGRHNTLNQHCVLLHARTLPGFQWKTLLAARDEVKTALRNALGGNPAHAQTVWWLIEGKDTCQPAFLGPWIDDLGGKSVIFLWGACIDPSSRQAHILCNPLTTPKTMERIQALHRRLSDDGFAVDIQAKEKHGLFQASDALHAITPTGIILRIAAPISRWIEKKIAPTTQSPKTRQDAQDRA